VWTLALWGVCLLAAAGGHLADARSALPAGDIPAAVALMTRVPDAAVIPARVADEVRVASQGAPLRLLVLAAVLAVLVGLPAVQHRRASSFALDHRPLRARRHTIALRAPPLQFA
jgi:hypothetical protein